MKVTVNIRDFGATCNDALQTKAIQDAIDHCFLAGGGEVQIPEGVFLTGGIRLRSRVTLHLLEGAVLKGSMDPEDYFGYLTDTVEPLRPDQITDAPYVHIPILIKTKKETEYVEGDPDYDHKRLPGSRWNNALIRAIDAEDVAIIGEKGSVLDGANCADEQGEEKYRGPHGITMVNTKRVTLRGYTIQNTGNWAHNLRSCDNVSVEGITALAGHDGLDVFDCRNVTITGSEFYTGDDCLAGFGNVNVFVSDCMLNSSCSAMRFGGTNVLVRKCRMVGPGKYLFRGLMPREDRLLGKHFENTGEYTAHQRMLSAFTYYADYSMPISEIPGNVIIEDCEIEQTDRFLHYNFSGNEPWQKGAPLENITFRNIRATGIAMPLTAYGTEEFPVEVTMRNISIRMRDGVEPAPLVRACHFRRILMENVDVTNFKGDCLILSRTEDETVLRNVTCDGLAEEDFVRLTDESFQIKSI